MIHAALLVSALCLTQTPVSHPTPAPAPKKLAASPAVITNTEPEATGEWIATTYRGGHHDAKNLAITWRLILKKDGVGLYQIEPVGHVKQISQIYWYRSAKGNSLVITWKKHFNGATALFDSDKMIGQLSATGLLLKLVVPGGDIMEFSRKKSGPTSPPHVSQESARHK